MPIIKFQHVVSCSSEDKVHKGENLLLQDHYRKWKCGTLGEKQISIILQLEKETKIIGIDIGNEGSALVEVLVGKSSNPKEDFQVLLVTSSFMSPKESRQETNLNQVRMFDTDKLTQSVANEKWDRVKIVCSQPFNNRLKYGLSFIKLHGYDDNTKSLELVGLNETKTTIGAFKMKSDDGEDKVIIGSLFNRMKEKNKLGSTSDLATTPLAIRNASQNGTSPKNDLSQATQKPPKNSDISKKKLSVIKTEEQGNKTTTTSNTQKRKYRTESKKDLTPSSSSEKPFHRLMANVIFVLSGYQNPQRGIIRDKAMAMGALYRGDWSKDCTHLVCAFLNTPKFNEVKKVGGKIVSEKWILECFNKRKRLPWRKYQLDQSDSEDSESDTEEELSPPKKKKASIIKNEPKKQHEKKLSFNKTALPDDSDDDYLASTDVDEMDPETDVDKMDADTDDELERVRFNISMRKSKDEVAKKPDTAGLSLPPLPDFFENYTFYLHGDLDPDKHHKIKRYITGCCGEINNYMGDDVNFVITDSEWIKDFDDALSENKKIKILKSGWIRKCLKENGFIHPTAEFLVKRKH